MKMNLLTSDDARSLIIIETIETCKFNAQLNKRIYFFLSQFNSLLIWKCTIRVAGINYEDSLDFFCLVSLSLLHWKECIRWPNFGFRLDNSSNFFLDWVVCLFVVRSLWFKTERIVFVKNRLFVLVVFRRQALGPISSASFAAFSVSRQISATARLIIFKSYHNQGKLLNVK